MKAFLIGFLFFVVTSAEAYENHLSKAEQKDFVRAITRAGWDTWAEGDFQYKYLGAGCNWKMKECWVYVEIKYEGRKATTYCHAEEVKEFSQVYEANKKRITLDFQTAITDCMNTWPE